MSRTHRTIDAVAVRVVLVACTLWLCGCASAERRAALCVAADVALAAPLAPVALAGAATGLAACR